MKTESLGFSLSPGEPDEIDLELASIGAVGDPAALSKIARAAEGPLRQAAAEITAYRLAHEATARPLRLPNRTPRRWTGGAGWALAAAAGLLLAVAAVSLPAIP